MKFPKMPVKKRRKKHKASILQKKDGTCYLCRRLHNDGRRHGSLHEHHIYPGANRRISEAEGFKVYLCPEHHESGREAAHRNIGSLRTLQQDCQREYEKTHSRGQFMQLVGRNYLGEWAEATDPDR